MKLFVWRYIIPDPVHYFDAEPYYELEKVIDTFSSLIWCERFQEPGEFELYLRADEELMRYAQKHELLITRNDTDRAMIPERIVLTTSRENGNYLKLSGKSAEGVMRRRIVQQKASFMSDVYPDAVYILNYLIQENIGGYWYYHRDSAHSPSTFGANRWVNVIQKGKDDAVTQPIDLQPYGQNLGAVIEQVCKAGGFGFKLPFDASKKQLKYCFYTGKDKSLNQSEIPAVIFSNEFNNLGDTEYIYDRSTLATFALVGGEGDGKDRKEGWKARFSRSYPGVGLNGREIFVDAGSMSSNTEGINGNAGKYSSLLNSAAFDAVFSANETVQFSGEVLPSGQFKYREHYFLGDTVSVQNSYGISGTAVVTGVEEVEDETGYKLVPKFSEWRAE